MKYHFLSCQFLFLKSLESEIWVIFSCVVTCLVIFDWMSDIIYLPCRVLDSLNSHQCSGTLLCDSVKLFRKSLTPLDFKIFLVRTGFCTQSKFNYSTFLRQDPSVYSTQQP